MSEEKFDAIVVGAGVAGCVAAYVLAKEGLDVLVIERGNYAGSKNMTGGRLYAHSLERVMPGFAEEAPVERLVTREKISFITDDDSVTLDYHTGEAFSAEAASYTVLRGKFDQWLQEKAESEGAQFIPGIRVDRLLQDETGRVTGVQAGEDELLAECVILADGVNSLLAQSIGLLPKYHAHQYAVGAKEVIGLSKQVINDRFGLSDGEGAAWLFAGSASAGLMGGGFLYTNEDSISLGVVCGLGDIEKSPKTVPQMRRRRRADYGRCCGLVHQSGLHCARHGFGRRLWRMRGSGRDRRQEGGRFFCCRTGRLPASSRRELCASRYEAVPQCAAPDGESASFLGLPEDDRGHHARPFPLRRFAGPAGSQEPLAAR